MTFDNFYEQIIAVPEPGILLPRPNRRKFLWLAAAPILTKKVGISEKRSEPAYRFLTPVCEVRMRVQHFASSSIKGFNFRNDLTNRTFCISAKGETDRDCLKQFTGSMAIAHYHFRATLHSWTPLHMRERVLTIDHDSRISPRAPFESVIAVDQASASDIQAFGYQPEPRTADAKLLDLWCLVRQDLYLNDQATPFLIVHWKHTVDFIALLDVIPGDGTELIAN